MKKIFLVLFGILVLSGCGNNEFENDNIEQKEDVEIKELGGDFYIEDGSVYYDEGDYLRQDDKVKGVDIETFEVLEEDYAKDKNNVYYEESKVYGANQETFEVLNIFYAKDDKLVYVDGDKVEDIDVNSFEVIEHGYSKDKNGIYFGEKKVEGIDANSVEVLGRVYIKDGRNVYYMENKIPLVDSNGFEFIGENYFKDLKGNVYYSGKKVSFDGDVSSLEFLNKNYAKDKNYVYFIYGSTKSINKVNNADLKTFEIASDENVKEDLKKVGLKMITQKIKIMFIIILIQMV